MFVNKKVNFFMAFFIMGQYSTELFSESKKQRGSEKLERQSEKKISQKLLNEILANEAVLLFQTLNYHWNLTGPEFHDYHLLFNTQYQALFVDLDKIAERVRAVGGVALGSMKEMLRVATLKEDQSVPKPKQMIVNLQKHYKSLIEQITSAIDELEKNKKDAGTKKFLEDLLAQHEQTSWMLVSLVPSK